MPLPIKTTLSQLCLIALALSIVGCLPNNAQPKQNALTIYAAASLSQAMRAVGEAYKKEHTAELTFNFAGSGTLAQQLIAAPRADIFLSANEQWMDQLITKNLIRSDSRFDLLENRLLIVANKDSDIAINTLADLAELDDVLFAIGDPDSVPAGRYAKERLIFADSETRNNLWQSVSSRSTLAPDAPSTLSQIIAKRNIVGFVYQTDYLSKADSLRLLFEFPQDNRHRIVYPAAITANCANPDNARAFLQFLKGPIATSIFERHGFLVANPGIL